MKRDREIPKTGKFLLPGIINYTCLLLGSDILKAEIVKNKRQYQGSVLFQRRFRNCVGRI